MNMMSKNKIQTHTKYLFWTPDLSSPSPTVPPPSTSPPPEFSLNPVATKTALAPPSSPRTVGSSSPIPSQVACFVSCGRSKQERWCADSPGFSNNPGGPSPSYRDIVASSRASCGVSQAAAGGGSAVAAAGVSPTVSAVAAAGASPSAVALAMDTAPIPANSWAPRIVLRQGNPGRGSAVFSSGAARTNPERWQKVMSRGARRRSWRAARPPRRPVPADLVGRCFNCFSTLHRASQCRKKTRCFRCRSPGHRSYDCPDVVRSGNVSVRPALGRVSVWQRISPANVATGATSPQRPSPAGVDGGAGVMRHVHRQRIPARVPVWRRISPAHEVTMDTPPQRLSPVGAAGGSGSTQGSGEAHAQDQGGRAVQQRRRRRPPRHLRQRPMSESDSVLAADPLPGMAPSETSCEALGPSPCIIDWTDQVARAEEDLKFVVVVYVIGDGPLAPVEEVASVIAVKINLDASSLVLRRASSSSYLLVLPDMALVERLVGLRQPISLSGSNFRLLCKRWSRLAGAQDRVLPFLIDIELRGIPNHVWEISTVDRLLSPHAWVQQVHPDTLELVDLSYFRCLAWSTDPSALPSSRELWVVEPPSAIVEDPPVKRVLAYPVEIRYSVSSHAEAPRPPPSDGGDDDDDSTRRRRRVRSPSPPPSSAPAGGNSSGHGGGARRLSIQERVGPSVLGKSRVGHSPPACSRLLALVSGSEEVMMERDGDAPTVASRGPEASPVPEAVAAPSALVPVAEDVERIHEELLLSTRASPVLLQQVVEDGPGLGLRQEIFDSPMLGCNSSLGGLGEATVWDSTGQPPVRCSRLSPQVGLATDGVDAPASPSSPQRSPAAVTRDSTPLLPVSSLLASDAGPAAPLSSLRGEVRASPQLRVYSRQRRRAGILAPSTQAAESARLAAALSAAGEHLVDGGGGSPVTPSANSGTSVAAQKNFLDKISKKTTCLLPQPPAVLRRARAPPTTAPRRSRRVAGMGAEFAGMPDSSSRKTVMRSLDIELEHEHVCAKAMDDYAKLFSGPLSASHVQALAALFGWTPPDDYRCPSVLVTY